MGIVSLKDPSDRKWKSGSWGGIPYGCFLARFAVGGGSQQVFLAQLLVVDGELEDFVPQFGHGVEEAIICARSTDL